ncbi:MAG: small multi-drug export protein [Oscillospiraceae bacterium]|nr:small multi-drug export protein [Oscillospiraceae bacterium]
MELFEWLTDTTLGQCVFTMLVSMIPIIELRGGLPFGVALGLPYYLAFPAAVIGNIIPAPFIIVYIRRIFDLMRRRMPRLNGLVDRMERKAHLKGQKVTKYKYIGLWLFVAIPLPGTGAWTGSLAAAFLDTRLKKALPAVVLGVITAGCIMLALTHVGINLFSTALA